MRMKKIVENRTLKAAAEFFTVNRRQIKFLFLC